MDEKVKELLERVRGTAGDTARAAGRMAGQMVDVAKLNVQLFDLNGEYNDVLRQLGQVMVNTHHGQSEDPEKVAALLERADETAERAAELKARIADLRQSQTCPACGAPCGKGDKFCRACGRQL